MKTMKLLIAITIMICLSVCYNAIAEDSFSIRGGVKFGQTIDEIRAIEKNNNCLVLSEPYSENGIDYYTTVRAHLSNYSVNVYYVCENNIMMRFYYKNNYLEDAYDELRMLLIQKYGSPTYDNHTLHNSKNMPIQAVNMIKKYNAQATSSVKEEYRYSEWIINTSDITYSIDLIDHIETLQGVNPCHDWYIYYTPIEEDNNKKQIFDNL